MLPTRKKLAEAAREVADHLQLIDHVKALQQGQKEIADAVAALGRRLDILEASLPALKAEVGLSALREAQSVVYQTQSGLNERMERLAVEVDRLSRDEPVLVRTTDKSRRLSKASSLDSEPRT
jgi:predicted  nucleic acid-binding Zn-ribbon protein